MDSLSKVAKRAEAFADFHCVITPRSKRSEKKALFIHDGNHPLVKSEVKRIAKQQALRLRWPFRPRKDRLTVAYMEFVSELDGWVVVVEGQQ